MTQTSDNQTKRVDRDTLEELRRAKIQQREGLRRQVQGISQEIGLIERHLQAKDASDD